MTAIPNLSRPPDTSSSRDVSSSSSNTSLNRSARLAAIARRKSEAEDPIVAAFKYFANVGKGTPVCGNDEFERNLVCVEKLAYSKGLPPEAISIMLEFAMSLRMGTSPCLRVLRCLLPTTIVPHQAVLRGVMWLCVGKIPISTQVVFIKWVLTVFDMIDAKDDLRAVYGFLFSFLAEEDLCPFICHLLYLLTRKENVHLFRVKTLLDLQSKLGKQPFLMHLLSLYKVFCPELVTLSLPAQMRAGFKTYNHQWKLQLIAIQESNTIPVVSGLPLGLEMAGSRKRKLGHMDLPALTPAVQSQTQTIFIRKTVPLAHVQSFTHLVENLHLIELPAQMGSLLGTDVALQYLNCVQDESAFLRLNFWLGQALHEEFLFCDDNRKAHQTPDETLQFLERLLSTQLFLQEGFYSTEAFLYKFLSVWDGSLFRPQILGLLSSLPVVPSSSIDRLLFDPLRQLFFTSTLFFKCSLMDSLNGLLVKWLTWHSVYAQEDGLDISLNSHTSMNMSLSGFMDSVMKLVHFVGGLASVGLQLEGYHALLLSFVLDFYDTVCDMFQKYGLPVVVMPPVGVFYPALFASDPVSVDRLAQIMYRYKMNLTSAKTQEKQTTQQPFHISRQTYKEFNQYLVVMVNCLWNSRMFQPGGAVQLSEELLLRSQVPEYRASFDLIHHPAFLSYAIDFYNKHWPEKREVDLNSIKPSKTWGWYLEYLFTQGFDGLKNFIQSNITWRPPSSDGETTDSSEPPQSN